MLHFVHMHTQTRAHFESTACFSLVNVPKVSHNTLLENEMRRKNDCTCSYVIDSQVIIEPKIPYIDKDYDDHKYNQGVGA